MCDIPVNLPTVASFLMLYSLRCGCIVIFLWTLLRSLFFLGFFLITFILMYMPDSDKTDSQPSENHFMYVFVPYVILIITESFVFIAAICLGMGIVCENSYRLSEYLVCRFCALVFEVFSLMALSFHHHYYIGWYLVFLMIIILEIYAFIVVYSYYVDMMLEQQQKCEESEMQPEGYANCEICENYAAMPDRRGTSLSGVSQDTREIGPSQTTATRDTTDTRDTRMTRDLRREVRDVRDVRDLQDVRDGRDKRRSSDTRNMRDLQYTPEPEYRGSKRNSQPKHYPCENYRCPIYP